MPEHIRALIVVLVLATAVFSYTRRTIGNTILYRDYTRRRNLWFAITLIAFLAHNHWLYFLLSGTLLILAAQSEKNPVALYFTLLFVLPVAYVEIPGMGLVNYFFELSHQRLLVLLILVPAYLQLISQKSTLPYGRTLPDKLLGGYLILLFALYLRQTTLTDSLREGFYLFIDVFLPYYVISRSLKSLGAYRESLHCFVIAVMVMAAIASFEFLKGWILYNRVIEVLQIPLDGIGYSIRSGFIRAIASAGQSIVMGTIMTAALGFYLFLQNAIQSNVHRNVGFALLVFALIASLSRGPWVGAAFVVFVYTLTGRHAVGRLLKLGVLCIAGLSLLSVLPGGEKVINLIPFLGTSDQHTITYREQLFENALIVVNRHPFLGSVDYLETPEMEAMRQGEGIIDIVNTYIGVALESGLVGLGLFVGFFGSICWGIIVAIRRRYEQGSEEHLLGRSLLATLAGFLLVIATVSNISAIPVVLWAIAGLGAGFINMSKQQQKSFSPLQI